MDLRRWSESFAGGRALAALSRLNARHPWSHNDHFHSWILAQLPQPCGSALDVGCGRGELAALLASHTERVVGADRDATMRAVAAARCAGLPNVAITADGWTEGGPEYDVVTMIAVLHHLDVADALRTVVRRLRPGGRFLCVGLSRLASPVDVAWDLASVVTNPLIGFVKHPWPARQDQAPPAFPVQDPEVTIADLRRLLDQRMPGAVLRRHLGFRHTIDWTKPGGQSS